MLMRDLGDSCSMLSSRTLLRRDGLLVADVACRHGAGRGVDDEQRGGHALVLVRRGCFRRSAEGVEDLLDPTVAFTLRPGEEHRYDHPHDHGDDCTSIGIGADLLATLWGGDADLPAGALTVDGRADLEHRLLVSALRRGDGDEHEIFERALGLCATVLERAASNRVLAGRPATRHARQALVDGAREALAADAGRSLPDLAAAVGTSPHHLSRIFGAATGTSIARHRMRLRARTALERLAAGHDDLARLAAEVGFSDQSHLCRVVRSEAGRTPAALRAALASG
jgi:AraC-like DNA-binding protein